MGKHVNEQGFCVYSGVWWQLALPQVIILVHLGICVAISVWAGARPATGWFTMAIGFPLGFLAWTLFEYGLHRWLLHHTRHPLLRRIFWNGFHREHHMYPAMEDPDPHGIHPAVSLPIIALLVGTVVVTTESGWGLVVTAGWILGYCAYEALHWLFHAGDPEKGLAKPWFVKSLSEAHTVHHLYRANKNYGFVTMFWDKAFGTYLSLAEVLEKRSKAVREAAAAKVDVPQDAQAAVCAHR